MEKYATKAGFTIRFGPSYYPWSNGMNKHNHYSADIVVRKIMETYKKISLEQAVEMSSWTHNMNVNCLGFDPMSLVTGKSVVYPGVSSADIASESMFDLEAIKIFVQQTNHSGHTCLLQCPCYELHTPRCQHLSSNHFHPFIPVSFCLKAGELTWFELKQPFHDEYGIKLLWRCEELSCQKEYCCGFA